MDIYIYIYIVLAYRTGDLSSQPYIVGTFDSLELAFKKAKENMEEDSYKFDCTIVYTKLNEFADFRFNNKNRGYDESSVLITYSDEFEDYRERFNNERSFTPS